MQVPDNSWMQHRAWVCLSTEDTGRKTERTLLNTKLLFSSQLLQWAGDKSGSWQTGCPCPGHAWTWGRCVPYKLRCYDTHDYTLCGVPCPLPLLSAGFAGCPAAATCPGVLALTAHGVEAQHAAHEVAEANPAGGVAVAQRHQAQQLRVGGQTCRGKRAWTRWEGMDWLWWPPAPCQQAGDTPSPLPCPAFLNSPHPTSCLRAW